MLFGNIFAKFYANRLLLYFSYSCMTVLDTTIFTDNFKHFTKHA